jgi:carboxylate-amine ligase
MPSPEECWRCLEAILPWLPLVLALSANSPWFGGELTGMASNRAPVLAELPRAGAPPPFRSYGEWEAWVERLVRIGVLEDYTRVWWDVRPHPALGTLEVRVPDQPTDVRLSAAFAALVQALCATALDGGLPGTASRPDYAQNRWSAARFGARAKLVHPDGDSFVPAAELAAELLDLVAPAAERLGSAALLARIDPGGCEADLQVEPASAQDAAAGIVARTLA